MVWWEGAVGYEVYIRSFADSDGDGVGDLRGLHERLDHLAWLGVDIVWVTPFYPSPMHDHGYDVADYRGVEPVFGTIDDVDACIAKAHDLGMRMIIDLVPNHSSSEHAWFKAARSSRTDPHRDFYMWRDPAPDGGPPNNWMSVFGGPAWTLDEETGQYWLHLFLPEQPDLNWDNPAVADEFDAILRFWLERGVDGFRIDVAHALAKHPDLPDNPPAEKGPDDVAMGTVADDWETLEHIYDTDQPGNAEVFRRWRTIADDHDAVLLGEVYLLEADRLRRYVADGDGLHLAFWFGPMHVPWDPAELAGALREGVDLPAGSIAWVQGSHDRARTVSRYGAGDVDLGRRRQLAMAILELGLPGAMFVYQGEELGLPNGQVTLAESQDPVAIHQADADRGRDVARTPMPWEPGPGLGFTTAERAWLPFGGRTDADTVAVQRDDPDSMLCRYRGLIALRHDLALAGEPVEWLDAPDGVVAYRRGGVAFAANLGTAPASGPVDGESLFTSGDVDGPRLGPSAAVVARLS